MHQVRLLNSVDEEDDILHVDASVSIHISRIIVVIDFPTGINSDEDDEVLCIDFAVVVKIAESNRLSGDLELNGIALETGVSLGLGNGSLYKVLACCGRSLCGVLAVSCGAVGEGNCAVCSCCNGSCLALALFPSCDGELGGPAVKELAFLSKVESIANLFYFSLVSKSVVDYI